ncbi:MAG: leucyl aminopeptidase family protein [Kofleriaceae bacterium]|nr:leucyl aminopeptidase family protein [Kofleriaceae bacterium]
MSDLNPASPLPLFLSLRRGRCDLPGGTAISALAESEASIRLEMQAVHLQIALPELSRSEQRYVVDQAIKSLHSVVKLNSVSVEGQGIDDDTLETIGLDLHHRFSGKITLPQHPEVEKAVTLTAKAEDLYRRWVNEDPSTRTSIAIASDTRKWAQSQPLVEVEVLEEAELAERGLRLLLAVGGASEESPPRLVIAHYQPELSPGSSPEAPLAIVGKGVTFDTGGINVKPYASYVSMMKNDMGGAALAVALFQALVESGYDKPLLLVVPTCENAVGEKAMRPGAVVESYSGKTVRIDHTDAEGRLILADAIAYAGEKYAPREFLCFATLTTSALNSYGPFATPVHFADDDMQARVSLAGQAMGEDFHFFPKRLWHSIANEDKEADLRNTARLPGHAAAGAGSRNAAHFLLEFANAPLCHFDIFASTWNWSGEAPGTGYGATGAPLRSILRSFRD